MKCYGWKLKVDIFRTEIRKTCLRMNIVDHWNIILRRTVHISSLDILESVILVKTYISTLTSGYEFDAGVSLVGSEKRIDR